MNATRPGTGKDPAWCIPGPEKMQITVFLNWL